MDINKLLQQANDALKNLVDEKKNWKLQQAEEARKLALEKLALEQDRNKLIETLGADLLDVTTPLLETIAENSKHSMEDIKEAISSIKIPAPIIPEITIPKPEVTVNVPAIKIPEFPKIKVPTPEVNYTPPEIRIPDIVMPDEMNVKGWVSLMGVDLNNPLPVQLRDANGKPVNLLENLSTIVNQGGGGGSRRVKIDNTSSEPIPISGTISATFSADFGSGEIGAETLRMVQATNAIASVNVVDAFGSTSATGLINADNRLRVSLETGGSGLTDAELRATSVPVGQVSGSIWSVNIASGSSSGTEYTDGAVDTTPTGSVSMGFTGDDGANIFALRTHSGVIDSGTLRTVQAVDAISSVNITNTSLVVTATDLDIRDLNVSQDEILIHQVSGANWSVSVPGTVAVTQSGTWDEVGINDSGNSITVDATDLDIRDLANATDSISTYQISGASWSVSASFDTTTALFNADNRLRVSLETGGSGLTDAELRASSVPVEQVSGSIWSVYTTGAAASTYAEILNPDGRVKVELPTGSSGLTDTELRATAVPVSQVSGANWSTNLATQDFTFDVKQVSGSIDSVIVNSGTITGITNTLTVDQLSGATWSVFATNPVNQGDAATALRVVIAGNSDASVTATQTGTWNITTLTGVTNSVQATIIDSSGVGYSGSNPVPVTLVSNSVASTVVVGDTLHDAADIGAAPLKIGGVAMQTNPTAVADGDRVNARYDDLGRQLIRPVQVRDLTISAYATFATGTEATLLAATAGSSHDLIYVLASNNSTVAVGIDIRPVLAGNIVMHLEIPANGVVGVSSPIPFPQSASDTGNAWTVDLPDITGTTVYVTALFSREI